MPNLMNLVLAFHPSRDRCWITELTNNFKGSSVRIIQLERNEKDDFRVLFEIITGRNNIEEINKFLNENKLLE